MQENRIQSRFQQLRKRVGRGVCEHSAVDFFNALTGPLLLELTEAHLPAHRERLYPPTVTLSMFIKQALDEDGSCQRAVNGWAAQRVAEGLRAQSVDTGAYCRARQRLPVEMVTALTRETGQCCFPRCSAKPFLDSFGPDNTVFAGLFGKDVGTQLGAGDGLIGIGRRPDESPAVRAGERYGRSCW